MTAIHSYMSAILVVSASHPHHVHTFSSWDVCEEIFVAMIQHPKSQDEALLEDQWETAPTTKSQRERKERMRYLKKIGEFPRMIIPIITIKGLFLIDGSKLLCAVTRGFVH